MLGKDKILSTLAAMGLAFTVSSTPVSAEGIVDTTRSKANCALVNSEINERVKSDEEFSLTQEEIDFLVDKCGFTANSDENFDISDEDNDKTNAIYAILAEVDSNISTDEFVRSDLLEQQYGDGITMKYLKEEFGDVLEKNPEIIAKLQRVFYSESDTNEIYLETEMDTIEYEIAIITQQIKEIEEKGTLTKEDKKRRFHLKKDLIALEKQETKEEKAESQEE